MILPIAYILSDDSWWNDEQTIDRIEYWYWSSLLGGAYRETQNQRCIKDIVQLFYAIKVPSDQFIEKSGFKERQQKVLQVEDYSNYETLVFKSTAISISNIETGILQYILSKQPKDFVNDDIYLSAWEVAERKEYYFENKGKNQELQLQDHHICPLGAVKKIGQSTKELRGKKECILNSVLNRTYISSVANELISDSSIDKYFEEVSELAKYGHCIPTPFIDKYKRKVDESDETYYNRITKARYDEIKRDIDQELNALGR